MLVEGFDGRCYAGGIFPQALSVLVSHALQACKQARYLISIVLLPAKCTAAPVTAQRTRGPVHSIFV